MGNAISFCMSALCIAIYLPIIMNALRQMSAGEIVVRTGPLEDGYARRYRGASATVYSLTQALSATVGLVGILTALSGGGFIALVAGILGAMLISAGGTAIANQLGYEVVTPEEQFASFIMNIFGNLNFPTTMSDISREARQSRPYNDGDTIIVDAEDVTVDTAADDDVGSPASRVLPSRPSTRAGITDADITDADITDADITDADITPVEPDDRQ